MKSIRQIDHTADAGIAVCGTTPEDVFTGAAEGMFAIILPPEYYKPVNETMDVRLRADSYADLLREWLAELLYFHATRRMIFSGFKIWELSEHTMEAIAEGFQLDEDQMQLATEVKSVTYHELAFEKTADGYEAQIIFDT